MRISVAREDGNDDPSGSGLPEGAGGLVSRAPGGEDIIHEEHGSSVETARESSAKGILEVFAAGGGGESDLVRRRADFSKSAIGGRKFEGPAPFLGEDFGGVVGSGDALGPVLGDGYDQVDGILFQLREEMRGNETGEGTEEFSASGTFSANANVAQEILIESPANDSFEGEGDVFAAGARL